MRVKSNQISIAARTVQYAGSRGTIQELVRQPFTLIGVCRRKLSPVPDEMTLSIMEMFEWHSPCVAAGTKLASKLYINLHTNLPWRGR